MPNANKLKRTAKRNRLKIFFLLTIALALVFLVKKYNATGPKLQNPSYGQNQTSPTPTPTKSPNHNIQTLISKDVNQLPGTYLVYIKDLKSGETYTALSDQKIPSASIYKLTVLYKAYDALEKGDLKKGQLLKSDLSVEEALNLMITISDNESALLLAEKLGWANINSFLTEQGIIGFDLMVKDYPTTTAKATGDLLEKIYKGEAVSKNASEEMMKLLLAQTRNDRIPLNLPLNIEVAHKTGELDNFRHDAGIVYGLKSDYIFVFLTETPVPEDSYQNIAQLSKKFFEALEND